MEIGLHQRSSEFGMSSAKPQRRRRAEHSCCQPLSTTDAVELLEQGSFLAEDQIATTFSICLNGDQINMNHVAFLIFLQPCNTS